MAIETVMREQVQILTFISYFLHTLDKCASNTEDMLQGVHSPVSEELAKEVDEMLSFFCKFSFLVLIRWIGLWKLHFQRGMVGVHTSHRPVFPHSHSSKFTKASAFSCGRSFVSIQSPTFWYSNGSTQIHLRSQRSKANAAKQGNSDSPVLRRLVTSGFIPADLHGEVKTTGVCSGTRLGNQLQEIRVNINSKIRLPRVKV